MNNLFNKYIKDVATSHSRKSLQNLCVYFRNSTFNKHEVAKLSLLLAKSGETLSFNNVQTADIPSTGGPSSLSTIICPLILKEYYSVPKLGIVGRPAGGIDVLSQIEGYKTKLDLKEIYYIIKKTNYCHFISNNKYTPLDSILFRYRSENNFKDIPSLVIASLLSKKVAVGVKNICLDIRYSKFGNFGKSLQESQLLSSKFYEVANLLGINSLFYYSNNNKLMQPYIGRGESILAINEYLNEDNNSWLNNHILTCKEMVEYLLQTKVTHSNLKNLIYKNLIENIEIQDGNFNSFIRIAETTKKLHIYEYISSKKGRVQIDIRKMRNLIVSIQKKYIARDNDFPDPCGIIFYKNQNENVSINDLILTYRVNDENLELFQNELKNIVLIKE